MAVALCACAGVVRVAPKRKVGFARLRALVVNGDWRRQPACCVVAWCGGVVKCCGGAVAANFARGEPCVRGREINPFRVFAF